ncbi:hypothetical protein L6164_010323 [Bauhinia variegata]|uniref:Uncharacterized protein n=1 Tax=Bauhinia variegata TaxID=167791 RepID=A0ACB9PMR3_BAUVA|nr:hypothetical protein L6164_010323 [Bauhinia variegata]
MARFFAFVALIVSAVCFSSLIDLARANNVKYYVTGNVYCDPCQFRIVTELSTPLPGVTLLFECKHENNETVTFRSKEVVSGQYGEYSLEVEGEHQGEDCKVKALKNSDPECNEILSPFSESIVLKKNMTVDSYSRDVSPFVFTPNQVTHDQCRVVDSKLKAAVGI